MHLMSHRLRAVLSTIGLVALLIYAIYRGSNNASLAVFTGVAALALSQTMSAYLLAVLDAKTLRAERWLLPGRWIESPVPFAGEIVALQGRFLLLKTADGGDQRIPAQVVFTSPTTIYDAKPPPPTQETA